MNWKRLLFTLFLLWNINLFSSFNYGNITFTNVCMWWLQLRCWILQWSHNISFFLSYLIYSMMEFNFFIFIRVLQSTHINIFNFLTRELTKEHQQNNNDNIGHIFWVFFLYWFFKSIFCGFFHNFILYFHESEQILCDRSLTISI